MCFTIQDTSSLGPLLTFALDYSYTSSVEIFPEPTGLLNCHELNHEQGSIFIAKNLFHRE